MANITSDTQIHGHPLNANSLLRGLGVGISFKHPLRCGVVLLYFFLLWSSVPLDAQQLSTESNKARKLYLKGQEEAKARDFEAAIQFYTKAHDIDPSFYETYLRKGSLYNAMGMEDSVYSNFEKYLANTSNPRPSVLSKTAQLAFQSGSYQAAEAYYNKLIQIKPSASSSPAVSLLNSCIQYALQESSKEVELNIEPLPSQVNRFDLQYLPTITVDNSTLIYTKRDPMSADEDIVVSCFKEGQWSVATSISDRINTPLNEGACTISADGRTLIFTSCDKRDSYGSCDLYITKRIGETWSRPKNLGRPVNSRYWESQPSVSADGKTIYFASNRPGGRGARDLWVSYLEEGAWSVPENLGSKVNTNRDETTPFIHPNGETLYFSSDGHVGMGGFDILRASKEDTVWRGVTNLGFPINTFNDEVGLLISSDGKTAYFGKEIQINRRITDSKLVTFELAKDQRVQPTSYIAGTVLDAVSDKPLRGNVQVYDLNRSELLFDGESDSISGGFLMVLPTNKELGGYVKKKGYLFHEFSFYSTANSIAQPDSITIRLRPIQVNESLVLRNIYFEFDSYELNEKSSVEIQRIVEVLEENPTIQVEIAGHTDNVGSDDYNRTLSEKRAKTIFDQLIKKGIDQSRVRYNGYGSSVPISANDSERGRQSNRRIEFRVLMID